MAGLDANTEQFDDEARLWEAFSLNRDVATRDKLIALYTPFARKLATHVYANRTSNDVEYMDYYQYGLLGLIEAVDRYQPEQNASFTTYSSYRIKGEIYSGLVRQTEKRQHSAYCKVLKSQRNLSILSQMGPVRTLEDIVNLTINLAVVHMIDDLGFKEPEPILVEGTIYHNNEYVLLKQQIKATVDELPTVERMVVKYHYFNHLLFEHIAEILDLSKSRISQIHTSAINIIRSKYNRELDVSY
ncbi:MAG: sigma-70 family RNA polymerase sigma factor [Gammaproteobacteria bacterium]|nr:sigma-70 family RNA polymerase sigma factor [Gammaproteobacteria bacterium]MDH5800661.1 sigma-70 family RNA polymerase sigma factor [Gammaproteobacteria bacterium]